MTTAGFLAEFPPISTEAWEQAIRAALKGADYDKLIWHAEDGLDIKPYYRAADLDGIPFFDAAPGEFTGVPGASVKAGWRIREQIELKDAEEANRAACAAVAAGAEEIAFAGAAPSSVEEIVLLLANLGEIPVHFETADAGAVRLLIERMKRRPHEAGVCTGLDPLADADFSAEVLAAEPECLRAFTIDAGEFHECGSTLAEEIGFALAWGVDFIAMMRERGAAVDRIVDSIGFSFAMGPEFFLQVAKLRAFRRVWAQAVGTFGGSREHAKSRIHARTARWNETVDDAHVNILRATTEAMSAVLGGADSVSISPHNASYEMRIEDSRRLARNIQLILKHEAQLTRVADAGGGSYFLEALTDELARKAWKQMQEIECAGGFCRAVDAGMIERVLRLRASARRSQIERRAGIEG